MTLMSVSHRLTISAAATVIAVACGGSEPDRSGSGRRCAEPGVATPCACTDGRTGLQICADDGVLGSCECRPVDAAGGGGQSTAGGDDGVLDGGGMSGESAALGGAGAADGGAGFEAGGWASAGASGEGGVDDGGSPCTLGDVQGCRCDDDVVGRRECDNGSFGACNCQVLSTEEPAVGCEPKSESCNELDDDCDGSVDEHFVCSDDSVRHAVPFERAVYLDGSTSPGACSAVVLQRFWPTLAASYIPGAGCNTNQLLFPEFDDGLYYGAGSLFRRTSSPPDAKLSTPWCSSFSGLSFGFDGQGLLHYACGGILYRGDGEIITGSINNVVAVLADGRVVVTRRGWWANTQYVVLSPSGAEIVRFPYEGMFSGDVSPVSASATTAGNTAYLGLVRTYDDGATERTEVLVYMVDTDSALRLVRRLPVPALGTFLVVSDGTVFVRSVSGVNQTVTAYLPDHTSKIVWRTTDTPAVKPHASRLLLAGPIEPVFEP